MRPTATNGPTATIALSFDDGELLVRIGPTTTALLWKSAQTVPAFVQIVALLAYDIDSTSTLGSSSAYAGFTAGTCIAYGKYRHRGVGIHGE